MRIKKLAVAALIGVMVLGMETSVYAATGTITDNAVTSAPQNVTATYRATVSAGTVRSVDIEWGNLQYTYTVANEGNWNPGTHQFENNSGSGTWSCETDADKIKVTNHSNTAVKTTFAYNQGEGYESVSGAFDKAEVTLATAEGTAYQNAPSNTATLTLSGSLKKNVPAATAVGSVTVSLGDA